MSSMTLLNSAFLLKLLTHLVIISSCCLINSKTFPGDESESKSTTASPLSLESSNSSPSLIYPAQSCNNGLGRLVYEKVSDHKLVAAHGSNPSANSRTESITRSGLPLKVLEECMRRCQEDKVTSIGSCSSFDFIPGQRRSSPYPKFPSGVSVLVISLFLVSKLYSFSLIRCRR